MRGGGDRQGGDGYRSSQWGDNVSNLTLGTDPNVPLAYAPELEHHHQIMSILGGAAGQIDRDKERWYINKYSYNKNIPY